MLDSKSRPNRKKILEEAYTKKQLIEKLETAFEKWKGKFGEYLKNHIIGYVGIKKITENGKTLYQITGKGQGGHIVNDFVVIVEIKTPLGFSKIEDIPLDTPFVCKIKIKSSQGQLFPKSAKSSMFPHNWSYERIQQEIAFVYENTVAKGVGLKKEFNGISNFEGLSTNGFEIRIQIKDENIINAHPINL